jgi:serine/threonine-protein kinase ULK/ATG1
VNKEKLGVNKKHEENLNMEIAIMQNISHPNVVKLYEVIETKGHKYLIIEFCGGGDLSRYIKKHGAMPERVAKHFLGQLAAGLKFLRQANLIHRDLKPQNLLLDSDKLETATLKVRNQLAGWL